MINFALCFLAYGDEHITELNSIGNTLSNYPTFVLTDYKTKIKNKSINVIETTEDFNFNLKYPIYRSVNNSIFTNINYDKKYLYNTLYS